MKPHPASRRKILVVAENGVREPLVDIVGTLPEHRRGLLLFLDSNGGGFADDTLFINAEVQLSIQKNSGITSATQAVGEPGHKHSKLLVFDVVQPVAVYLDSGRLAGLVDMVVFGFAGPFQVASKLPVLAAQTSYNDALWILVETGM